MSQKMCPVVHFELPAEDRARMAKFYGDVFGWKSAVMGPEMGNYVVVTTTECDKTGRPLSPGAINGGLFQKNPEWGALHPSVVIAVDDIKRFSAEVAAAGGKVLTEPMEIPGVGMFAAFVDTEGNRLSMLQPARERGE